MPQVVCALELLLSLRCVSRPFVVHMYLGRNAALDPAAQRVTLTQPPAWSLRSDLTFGLAAVDAVNATHMMLQVACGLGFGCDCGGRGGGFGVGCVMRGCLVVVVVAVMSVSTFEHAVAVAAITRSILQFIEGSTGKVLDESWIVQ